MTISKESFLLFIFASLFLPKYGIIDPTIITSIAFLPFLIGNEKFKLPKVGTFVVFIIIVYLIIATFTIITELNQYHIIQLKRDAKLIISSLILLIISGFSPYSQDFSNKVSKILALLFKTNIILMSLQLVFPEFRIYIMEIFNFGYGLDQFESFHISGIRPTGTFQSYDIASIILSVIIMLRIEKVLYLSKFWLILGIFFVAITARTGLILFVLYILFKKPLHLIILGVIALYFAIFISDINPYFFESYLWLKDDLIKEYTAISSQLYNINLFGNRLPSYYNNSLGDVGYEHILLTYGYCGLFLILTYYLFFILKSRKFIRIILAIVIFAGSFKTNLFTPSFFLMFFHIIAFSNRQVKVSL